MQETEQNQTAPQPSKFKNVRAYLPKPTSILMYILVILFGISCWIGINGIFSQIPLIIDILPEKYALPSYMVLAFQFGNICPLLYLLVDLIKNPRIKRTVDTISVIVITIVGTLACVLIGALWNVTTPIGGQEVSLAFLILVFVLGCCDTSTSVIYFPVISEYKYQYIAALEVGQNVTGILLRRRRG